MNNTFDSKGGEQNIAQGKNAIGKQKNNFFLRLLRGIFTQGNQSPAIHAGGNVAVTYGMSSEEAAKLARELLGPQLEAKDEQIKALAEAVTALAKADAPAKSINEALQALEQGDTAKAQAIFAEVLRSKEAEGQKANKEAAAAARHLGALAYMNNPKEALAAYQKAVQLDPDNAGGWNNLGNVYWTLGELDKAEEMYRKSLDISEALGLKAVTASVYGNLGNIYHARDLAVKAEEMYRKSLALYEALGSKEGMVGNYENLSAIYWTHGELDKMEAAWQNILRLYQELGHPDAKKAQQLLDELAQHRASQPAPPAASPRR